jgi:hypothetical protein
MFNSLSLGSLSDSTIELELRFPSAALSVSLDLMLPNRGLEPDLFVSGLKKETSFFFSSNLIVNNRRDKSNYANENVKDVLPWTPSKPNNFSHGGIGKYSSQQQCMNLVQSTRNNHISPLLHTKVNLLGGIVR